MKLTTAERGQLIERVAQALCWAARSQQDRDDYRYRARIVVDSLDSAAHHGATLKRAADKIIHALPAEKSA
jgi:hypothetical protein